jgi:biotin transport system substrate-specific component
MQQALIPSLVSAKNRSVAFNTAIILMGVVFLAVSAQISMPLPFTPVPLTGQTFGVALVSLLFGRRLGVQTVLAYLIAGAVGLPVFSMAASGLVWGPTLGYLIGMFAATILVGTLADRGWTKSFWWSYGAAALGSVVIFAFGLVVLSFFIPAKGLLAAGLLPFLPGDILKDMLAAAIATKSNKFASL